MVYEGGERRGERKGGRGVSKKGGSANLGGRFPAAFFKFKFWGRNVDFVLVVPAGEVDETNYR